MAFFAQTGPNAQVRLAQLMGPALAQGVARNFVPPETLAHRRMLQGSLQGVRDLANNPNATPMDITLGLMEAGAGIPGSEKYLSALLPQILQMQQYKNSPAFGQPEQPVSGQQSQPVPQLQQNPLIQGSQGSYKVGAQAQLAQQQPIQAQQGTGIQLGDFVPLDIGTVISPQQSQEIIRKAGASGGDPNIVKGLIRDYNEGTIGYNDLINSNVDRRSAQIQKQLALESKSKDFIDSQLSPNIPEERKNIYYSMLKKELPKHNDLTSAWQAITRNVQGLEKQFEEYPSHIPEANMVGIGEGKANILRQISKNIVAKDPLAIPILEKIYTQKGHPITEAAKIINPLPSNVSNIVNKAGDYREYLYPKGNISEQNMINNITEAENLQSKEIPRLAKELKRNWNENLSLINLYTDLKVRGWLPSQIQNLFDSLKEEGLPFSEYQEAERVQLASPPKIPLKYINFY